MHMLLRNLVAAPKSFWKSVGIVHTELHLTWTVLKTLGMSLLLAYHNPYMTAIGAPCTYGVISQIMVDTG